MKKYRLAVCKGPNCRRGGADAVFAAFKERVAKAGLSARCTVYRGGCYGLCHLGPNVVVREDAGHPRDPFSREDYQLLGTPDEAYYGAMSVEKVDRVVAEHIGQDRPVEEYIAKPEEGPPPGLGTSDLVK